MLGDFDIITYIKEQIRIVINQSRKELVEESNMEINERVRALEVKEKELRQDVREIKEQVTNHLPTQIQDVKDAVDALTTQHVAVAAVKQAWDTNIKRFLIVIGIIWTVLRIVEVFLK